MFWDSAPARALREGGVPVYRDIEAVVDTLVRLVDQHDERAHGVAEVGDRRQRRSPETATSNRGSSSLTAA